MKKKRTTKRIRNKTRVAPKKTLQRKPKKLSQRVPSGVPGLDKEMGGGFLRSSSNLIGGGAGSGKTIFCMQFLIDGIKKGENGVFISFEEKPEKIIEEFEAFGWDLEKKIKENKLAILYYIPEQVDKVIEAGGGTLRDVIESINAKRIVIDSLTAFAMLYRGDFEERKGLLNLFAVLHNLGITSLLTSEEEADIEKHKSTIMEFEVDGVILLYNLLKKGKRERYIEVFKMKETRHSPKLFALEIGKNGLKVLRKHANI